MEPFWAILVPFWEAWGPPKIEKECKKSIQDAFGKHFGRVGPPMIDFGTIFGRFYLDFGRFGVDFGLDLGPAWIDFARNLELLGPSLVVTLPWDPRADSRSVTMRGVPSREGYAC